MNLVINIDQNEDHILVHVGGEIDAYTAPKLREQLMPLAEEQNQSLIISLKDVSYIDSTGLGVFIGLFKEATKNNGNLQLIDLSERLERLFHITGLNNVMTISSK